MWSLTLQYDAHHGAWLHGVLRSGIYTVALDSAVGCTPQSILRNFDYLTPWCDACKGDWLSDRMYTTELDSVAWCTPCSLTSRYAQHCGVRLLRKCPFFMYSYLICTSFNYVLSKNFWSKKDNLWLVTISEIFYLFSYLQILRMECHGVVKRSSNLFSSRSMVIAFTACSPSLLSSLLYQLFSAGIIPSQPAVPPSWAPSSTSSSLQV